MLTRPTIRHKHFLDWESSPSTVVDCAHSDAKTLGPLLNTERLSIELDQQPRARRHANV